VGITGTGGAGKSSLTDELLMRFVRQFPDRNIAVVAMDPTRRRSGGALLGDRIRMNALSAEQVFMRSLATRRQNLATSAVLADVLNLLRYAGFDLIGGTPEDFGLLIAGEAAKWAPIIRKVGLKVD
jgi:methylmalonyl-CoA mutase